jgi:hypothetical protein
MFILYFQNYINYNFLTCHQYYLVDTKYPNKYGYLGSYKNERYHFQTFRCRGQPTSREERFNRALITSQCH